MVKTIKMKTAIWQGERCPRNWGLTISMVANYIYLLNGMILQVPLEFLDAALYHKNLEPVISCVIALA